MQTQIRKIGNSLGSLIPSVIIRELDLKLGTKFNVTIKNKCVVLEPVVDIKPTLSFSERELLNGIDYHTAHGDSLGCVLKKEAGYD
ncbi:hypothetical protein JI57_04485 [Psychromonas sp. PRT-SC03]|nr:hypothetical protein JI57_04485 [Psychromonas sp. PRT-SC03]